MGYEAIVVADSIAQGVRLTTLQVTMPRFILAEFNTHRMLSRNSASSRAIPVEKRIAAVEANPFVPEVFAENIRGMQAGAELESAANEAARNEWLAAASVACAHASALAELGVHKQWANRLIEPFCWHTVVVTATEWENFFNLRISPEAQPEMRLTAIVMKAAMDASTPRGLCTNEWHLPYVTDEERYAFDDHDPAALPRHDAPRVSSARCARVSYLTQDGRRDLAEDLRLADRLQASGHMSPFEHAARVGHAFDYAGVPTADGRLATWTKDFGPDFVGNFRWPFIQYRKTLPGEAVFQGQR